MTALLDAAHAYGRLGWRVVQLHHLNKRGVCTCRMGVACNTPAKHPLLDDWPNQASSSGADIQAWWDARPDANVGIVTGSGSGLWVLDVDPDKGGLQSFNDLLTEHGPMPATRVHRTGSGGFHYLFPWPDFDVRCSTSYLGNGIDVRGTNGQVVAPPSVSSKGRYDVLNDAPLLAPPGWLLDRLREHSDLSQRSTVETATAVPVDTEQIPLDIRILLSQIVEKDKGRYSHFHGIVAACRRYGFNQGQIITLITPWCIAVNKFANRVPGEVARSWGKLEAADAKQAQWMDSLPTAGSSALLPERRLAPAPDNGPDDVPSPERTSWWPRELTGVLSGEHDEAPPEFLTRIDGSRLFYRGKVNGLLGESESGKTWIALLACAQALQAGQRVLYLDFEDTASGIISRLRALGTSDDDLTRLAYIGPDETLHLAARTDLREALDQTRPDLTVLDGVNAAMTLLGLDLDNNKDATHFSQTLLRPLSSTDAAVIYVDHVPKNKDSRGKGGIGAQAKRAMTTGCAVLVDVLKPFGRGTSGKLRLTVDKDRAGMVRAICPDAKSLGVALLTSDEITGRVRVTIEPAGNGQDVKLLMEQVCEYLKAVDNDSKENIAKGISKRRELVDDALATLLAHDHVAQVPAGSGFRYRLVSAYTIADEVVSNGSRPSRPEAVPDVGQEDGSKSSRPRPFRDGGTASRQRVADGLVIDADTGEIKDVQT